MLTVTRDGGRWIAVRTMPIPGGGTLSITSDATPAPGETVAELGDGVTVVERTPPARSGCVWAGPYAANCAEHGWIVSRRTIDQAAAEGRAHIAREHRVLQCPFCGQRDLTEPADNGYIPDATQCRACGARMTADAATIGHEAHGFIWNSRNAEFRGAGFTGVSINEAGRGCSGGMEDLPAGHVAWQSADGWLYCRMHVDALVREISTPRGRLEHARQRAERVCREARNAAHDRYLSDHDMRAYDRAVIETGHARRASLLEAWHTYQAETGQATAASA